MIFNFSLKIILLILNEALARANTCKSFIKFFIKTKKGMISE